MATTLQDILPAAKHRLPQTFIRAVLVLCLLPTVLHLFGVQFGFGGPLPDPAELLELNEESRATLVYQALAGRFIYQFMVSVAMTIAFLTAVLAFIDYTIKRRISTPVVGVALFCAGLFDAFEVLTSAKLLNDNGGLDELSSFTWFLGCCFHALVPMIGTGIFICLKKRNKKPDIALNSRFVMFISLGFILITILAINVLLSIKELPAFAPGGEINSALIAGIPYMLYLISFVFIFPMFYRYFPSTFALTLILSLLPAILAQLHMTQSSHLFDSNFMLAHYLTIISYIIPFCGLGLNYLETLRKEKSMVGRLKTEVVDRKKAEELTGGVLNSSPYSIVALEAVRDLTERIIDFKIILANPTAWQILFKNGIISPNQSLNNTLLSPLFPSLEGIRLMEEYKQVVLTDKPLQVQRYGSILKKWLHIQAVKYGDGCVVMINDITEEKLAQEHIFKSEQKFRNLFEQSRDVIFIINRSGQIIDINQSAAPLFNISLSELKMSTLERLFKADYEYEQFLQELLQRGSIAEREILLNKVGEKQPINALVSATAQYDEEGRVLYFQGIVHDISSLKRAEQARFVSHQLDASERVARTIAHEVRNPLTNVSLALGQLQQELELINTDYSFYFDLIERNCKRINLLISQLLNSTRAEYLELAPNPLNDLLDDTLDLAGDRIRLNEIKVEKEYTHGNCEVMVDADKIKIALLNIVINAIEAMQPKQGVLQLRTYKENEKAVLEIIDNGIGISQENLGKLFEPFYTEKVNGTGLGLTGTRNIIQNHNAMIDVESRPGEGSRFKIIFN